MPDPIVAIRNLLHRLQVLWQNNTGRLVNVGRFVSSSRAAARSAFELPLVVAEVGSPMHFKDPLEIPIEC